MICLWHLYVYVEMFVSIYYGKDVLVVVSNKSDIFIAYIGIVIYKMSTRRIIFLLCLKGVSHCVLLLLDFGLKQRTCQSFLEIYLKSTRRKGLNILDTARILWRPSRLLMLIYIKNARMTLCSPSLISFPDKVHSLSIWLNGVLDWDSTLRFYLDEITGI